MTTPLWVLLGFAGWTLLLLATTIGVYRFSLILTGRGKPADFRADEVVGADWYKRAIRAHMNCIENLPVYASIALVAAVAGIDAPILGTLAVVLLAARVGQSVVHVAFRQTDPVVSLRFLFFATQLGCMVWMGVYIALAAR